MTSHVFLIVVPVGMIVGRKGEMALTVLGPAIVTHPNIVAGIRKNESIRLGGIIPKPLKHVAVLSVDHKHSRLFNAQIIGKFAWYSVQ